MLTFFNLLQRILCDTEFKALLKSKEKILTKSALHQATLTMYVDI